MKTPHETEEIYMRANAAIFIITLLLAVSMAACGVSENAPAAAAESPAAAAETFPAVDNETPQPTKSVEAKPVVPVPPSGAATPAPKGSTPAKEDNMVFNGTDISKASKGNLYEITANNFVKGLNKNLSENDVTAVMRALSGAEISADPVTSGGFKPKYILTRYDTAGGEVTEVIFGPDLKAYAEDGRSVQSPELDSWLKSAAGA